MILQNAVVLTGEFVFERLDVELQGERIVRLAPAGSLAGEAGREAVDLAGSYLLPGLVDIHTHGAAGYDFCDADSQGLERMLAHYGSRGVTSAVCATMSLPLPALRAAVETARPLMGQEGHGAVLRGVNLEGPFLNPAKKGAQGEEHLLEPAPGFFRDLQERAGNAIRMVDLAPELEGALDFIRQVSPECTVSLAHSCANYEEAVAGFEAGATHVTHLYNGMAAYHHRDPGLVGAAMDRAAQVELIADGLHLHPSVVRGSFRAFGPERICLVSDSMRAAGMPDGSYTLGGQGVNLVSGKATLEDGTLAGSSAHLADCCRNVVAWGVPLEQAVRAASATPARAVGLDGELGRIAPGLRADLLVWDPGLELGRVMVGGRWLDG